MKTRRLWRRNERRPPIGTPWPRRRTPLRGRSSIPSSRRWHELRNPKEPGRSDPYAAAVASFRDATVFALPRHLPFSSAGQQL
ncbi:hypothetical protein B296_00023706 [Ensete ventricosum]|uniref:Uncharacterized protein n=1 Tax=Ensete ventricosum TaxID=4639 RepID=A0A426Z8G7_ENSVE|nr:hypothetical protein B296_00023706 [Ensete ventricosum]